MQSFLLNDGHRIPALGLGTWKAQAGQAKAAVLEALKLGYRHIDCAWIYGNEAEIGEAFAEAFAQGIVTRDQLFVTSKLWNAFHDPAEVEPAIAETLTALRLEHLDLYLMHWPVAFRPGVSFPKSAEDLWPEAELPPSKTFAAMLALRDKGLIRSVGVSNFSPSKLKALIDDLGVAPAVNQVELHPYNPQLRLRGFCKSKGIHLTGYSPLGSMDRPSMMRHDTDPPLLENEMVQGLAHAEGVTPAQLLLAWGMASGHSVIPKSSRPQRLAENLAAADHTLSDSARNQLDAITIQHRYIVPAAFVVPGVTYTNEDFWA